MENLSSFDLIEHKPHKHGENYFLYHMQRYCQQTYRASWKSSHLTKVIETAEKQSGTNMNSKGNWY